MEASGFPKIGGTLERGIPQHAIIYCNILQYTIRYHEIILYCTIIYRVWGWLKVSVNCGFLFEGLKMSQE